MSDKHPYVLSTLHLTQIIEQLRNSFPQSLTINSEMLQKLGIAPNNEGYVINTVRYLGIIDENGKKTEVASSVFSKHEDTEFSSEFGKMVRTAYKDLFDLQGDKAWTLDQNKLISFFRGADKTGANVGYRQALTFQTLASLSGRLETVKEKSPRTQSPKPGFTKGKNSNSMKKTNKNKIDLPKTEDDVKNKEKNFALTVRIEINLPAGADKETYDKIFQSLRENLLDAK